MGHVVKAANKEKSVRKGAVWEVALRQHPASVLEGVWIPKALLCTVGRVVCDVSLGFRANKVFVVPQGRRFAMGLVSISRMTQRTVGHADKLARLGRFVFAESVVPRVVLLRVSLGGRSTRMVGLWGEIVRVMCTLVGTF